MYAYAIFDQEKHTFDDWGLMLSSVSVPLPAPKILTIPIPGMDGQLDLSEAATGEPVYNSRTMTLYFDVFSTYDEWPELISEIANYLHGKTRTIVLDNDPEYYYSGRFTVDVGRSDEATGSVVITGLVDPFKYELEPQAFELSSPCAIIVNGSRMTVVPEFTASAQASVWFKGVMYNIPAGDSVVPELRLVEGENNLTFTGTSNLTMTYLRGSF